MRKEMQQSDPVLDRLSESAAIQMWELEAVKVRLDAPFQLASGNFSPVYFDCRRVISEPTFMSFFVAAARLLCERSGVSFDCIAGGETAGIPFAAVLAANCSKPMVYIRKKAKGYGGASRVEGELPAGSKVLLVEDLITDGGSKLGFLDAIEGAGCVIDTTLVLCDRQQGGRSLLAERQVSLAAIVDRDTLMSVARETGRLDEEGETSLHHYFADPVAWHRRRGLAFSATHPR